MVKEQAQRSDARRRPHDPREHEALSRSGGYVLTNVIDLKKLRRRRLEAATGCEGLNPDHSVDMGDPCNELYPTSIEDHARCVADAIYSAALDAIDGELTTEQDDALYQQCLVNSRRMLLDPEYAALIEGMA